MILSCAAKINYTKTNHESCWPAIDIYACVRVCAFFGGFFGGLEWWGGEKSVSSDHLPSWSCQHWECIADGGVEPKGSLIPAVPLLHPTPCPSCSEVSRWAVPKMTHAYLQGREALVLRPWWNACCWQAGSSVAWQQTTEGRLLCPCSYPVCQVPFWLPGW